MNDLVKIFIGVAIVGVIFFVLWRKGYLDRFANYIRATREELKRCTWPTLAELQGSTVVVFVSIVLLGGFVIVADYVITRLLLLIT